MKNVFLLSLIFLLMSSCSKEEWRRSNPYIPELAVQLKINTDLPAYTKLQYPGNALLVYGYGVNGIIIINTGTTFLAYEATCANHQVTSCSALELVGVEAHCTCEDALEYNLYLGIAKTAAQYPLLQYRVYQNGSELMITN